MSDGAVVVVGSVNADLVVSVRELPRPGETVTGGVFARYGGGKGANQAGAAAPLGARGRVVGAGVAVIVVDEQGENQIAVASGANGALTAAHVKDALQLENHGVVLLNHEVPPEVVAAGVEAARAAGWTAILNPAPAREL